MMYLMCLFCGKHGLNEIGALEKVHPISESGNWIKYFILYKK
jgi:hypothetical protein